jgi:hypothetical protein
VFDSWRTYDGKNSSEFKHAVAVMHRSSLWMLGEEEGLSGDLTSRSLGRRTRSCDDLSSDKSEFLHKRNLKEDRK